MNREPRTVLTIAGSDSGGGAGIQADLKTFAALGCYGATAITAITAQNTQVVASAYPLPTELVTLQIETVAGDIAIHATKTGMLATAAIVEAVAAAVAGLELPNLVVDPVMVAKSGDVLLDRDAVRAVCNELVPRARVVTPNIPEAEAMTGLRITTLEEMYAAAARIKAMGPTAVVIKGGHAAGDDIVDLLVTADGVRELHVPRVHTRNTHGTGCTFASAIAALLARGESVPDAVVGAQTYVAGAIRHALAVGHGHGPLDHFWQMRPFS